MARELEFDGFWEGNISYTCDCSGCRKRVKIRFDSEAGAKDFKSEHDILRKQGWLSTKVNGNFKDFCSESCRNKYIRNNTI